MRVGRGGPDGQTLTRIAWPNNIKSSLAGFSDSRPAFPGDCVQRIAAYHCGRRAEQARPLGGAFRRRTGATALAVQADSKHRQDVRVGRRIVGFNVRLFFVTPRSRCARAAGSRA